MDEIFESAARSAGDMTGVFEFDGDTSYFYLYELNSVRGNKILGAIQITSSPPKFAESDIAIEWCMDEEMVGFSVKGIIWAAFDCQNIEKFGGSYFEYGKPDIPAAVKEKFNRLQN